MKVSASDSAVSPKLAAAYRINSNVELYANWGRGFHSNDARGTVNPDTPVQGLSKGEGEEIGARFELGTFNITTTYWWLELDSELKFVGDSNSVEPGATTRRRGYEVVAFWRPLQWIAIDAVYTGSRARYVDSPDGVYVAGAVENAGELGVSLVRNYFYGANVAGLGPPGEQVDGRVSRVEEPLTFRVGVKYAF